MEPLASDALREHEKLARELRKGNGLSQAKLDGLVAEWERRVRPDSKDRSEMFSVARPAGGTGGVVGPRWIFHLFGLRHRAVGIVFKTQTGLIVLQQRSATKQDWPGALDMAVAGHLPQGNDGSDISYEAGAWKEIEEEIGLKAEEANSTLVEKKLLPIGEPYFSFDCDLHRNPPFLNAEVRQVFGATLTGDGLARIHFADGEAMGLLLVTPETAWHLLADEPIASGMRYSLPRYLDWLEKNPDA